MANKKPHSLSSRDLLQRIGLGSNVEPKLLIDDEAIDSPLDTLADALRERFESMGCRHLFQPGDLVSWKPGLKNRRLPGNGKPAIVLEVLSQPVFDTEEDSGGAYFREPLDMVLGIFLEDGEHRGEFLSWHFDSRRFQPWRKGEQ